MNIEKYLSVDPNETKIREDKIIQKKPVHIRIYLE